MKMKPRLLGFLPFILVLFALPAHAAEGRALLRIDCHDAADRAEVMINDEFKGECPVNVVVNAGMLRVEASKRVDAWRQRTFVQDIRVASDTVKELEVTLGPVSYINAEAQQQFEAMELERRQQAEAAERERQRQVAEAQERERQAEEARKRAQAEALERQGLFCFAYLVTFASGTPTVITPVWENNSGDKTATIQYATLRRFLEEMQAVGLSYYAASEFSWEGGSGDITAVKDPFFGSTQRARQVCWRTLIEAQAAWRNWYRSWSDTGGIRETGWIPSDARTPGAAAGR